MKSSNEAGGGGERGGACARAHASALARGPPAADWGFDGGARPGPELGPFAFQHQQPHRPFF